MQVQLENVSVDGVGRYHQGLLYVIDVSQSVEYDHPNALEFLRKDCINVNSYFRRRHGVAVMTSKELFDFITDLSVTDDNIDDYLAAAMKTASQRSPDEVRRLEADEEVNGMCCVYSGNFKDMFASVLRHCWWVDRQCIWPVINLHCYIRFCCGDAAQHVDSLYARGLMNNNDSVCIITSLTKGDGRLCFRRRRYVDRYMCL